MYKRQFHHNTSTKSYELHLILRDVVCDDGVEPVDIRHPEYQSPEKILAEMALCKERVAQIIAPVCNATRYKQVKYLNHWLTHNNSPYSGSNLSTFFPGPYECVTALKGSTGLNGPLCESYSRAFKVLCDALEIPCVLSDGYAGDSLQCIPGLHMWNAVEMDNGKWYAVDVTWNDPRVIGTDAAVSGYENECYLLVGKYTKNKNGLTFCQSHDESNTPNFDRESTSFINAPQLEEHAYIPPT